MILNSVQCAPFEGTDIMLFLILIFLIALGTQNIRRKQYCSFWFYNTECLQWLRNVSHL